MSLNKTIISFGNVEIYRDLTSSAYFWSNIATQVHGGPFPTVLDALQDYRRYRKGQPSKARVQRLQQPPSKPPGDLILVDFINKKRITA